jgi:peptidoglycan/LPS O-acetylase OafA/YrhL
LIAAVALFAPNLRGGAVRVPLTVFVLLPALVWFALPLRLSGRTKRFAAWLGGLSYPLYAIHLPLLNFLTPYVGESLVGWLIVSAALIPIAAVVERFYDAPLRGAARRWLAARKPLPASHAERGIVADPAL